MWNSAVYSGRSFKVKMKMRDVQPVQLSTAVTRGSTWVGSRLISHVELLFVSLKPMLIGRFLLNLLRLPIICSLMWGTSAVS